MPARARPASSTATEVAPQENMVNMMPGLQFNEALSWRAGKAIPVADLLRRLQALSKEMRDMEQEENERQSFTRVAKELASPNLLTHKDKGVKAWTASCLVDILRLCAPDAPYTEQQLRDIFTMLITSILPALSDPSNAYNVQHTYVLQSLSQVKSIVLVTDIPNSENLILYLFTSFFDILSGFSRASGEEQLPKNVDYNMTSILVTIVDESSSLPQEAVDTIVAQFLRTDPRVIGSTHSKGKKSGIVDQKQSTLVLKELPPAYNMAKMICNSCEDKMAREISKYFNDVIVEASASSHQNRRSSRDMEDVDDSALGPTEEDLKELHKAHRLLRELWRACPAVLQNVIPQLEAELSAENLQLRLLATETLGDIISGIGAAGPPPPPVMDPATYPQINLAGWSDSSQPINLLTKPRSPQSFPQAHSHAYTSFLSRRQDKSAVIRSAWTVGIGRILTTSAGGVGLNPSDQQRLVEDLSRMLNDADEKVRIAAIKAVATFSFRDIIDKLGPDGSVATAGSVLSNLAERIKDRKHPVRIEATWVLARLWGVASGEIAAGNEQVNSILGATPSKILNAAYIADLEINVLLDHVFFEALLPLSYPPIKSKSVKPTNGDIQRVKDSQTNGEEIKSLDPDKIRTERMLLLGKSLDERASKIFFARCAMQAQLSKYLIAYLQSCEDYNNGVMDKNEVQIKDRLSKLISELAKLLPDQSKVSADLWKFAKMHDRRAYQLIRFCMAPESDYRTVYKALKELNKRIETLPAAPSGLIDTLTPLLYRTSILIYNKSHVPAIMEFSRTDAKSLGSIAHEVMKDISSRTPEVLKAHVSELCRLLQEKAPSLDKPNVAGAVDDLKACAAFARKFPSEIPQDQEFTQAMTSFALRGSPPETAKHAISIVMVASKKKEILAKDLARRCIKGFTYGSPGFLSRLAALSQLSLLAPSELGVDSDVIVDIATKEILLQVRTTFDKGTERYQWATDIDEECNAKCWALKILANKIRSHRDASTLQQVADPVYTLLTTLVSNEGELSTENNTPPNHKSRLRLTAARLLLKLCISKPHEVLLTPAAFHELAEVAQDALFPVRSSFVQRLKKYLAQTKLPPRFYVMPFLLAFEPDEILKAETVTWIRSRAAFFASLKSQQAPGTTSKTQPASKASTILESVFAQLLSLLAHHPDFGDSSEELLDSARYIMFYLSTVANEDNISLIFHIAQRVKGCRDAVSSPPGDSDESIDYSERLYVLSDLAQQAIHSLIDAHNWSLQTIPSLTRLTLPKSLFAEIKDHELAITTAEKNFLPERVKQGLEIQVRNTLRKPKSGVKKRKSEGVEDGLKAKKAKTTRALPIRDGKTTKERKKVRSSGKGESWDDDADDSEPGNVRERGSSEVRERRRSGRVSAVANGAGKSYAERDDEEDERELEELNGPDELAADDDDVGDGDEAADEDADVPMSNPEDEPPADADIEDPPTPPTSTSKAASPTTPKPTSKARARARAKPSSGTRPPSRAKPPVSSKTAPAPSKAKPAPASKPKSAAKGRPNGKAAAKAKPAPAQRAVAARATRSRGTNAAAAAAETEPVAEEMHPGSEEDSELSELGESK
ncbi:hypothetical protein MMC26_001585 [Xylographa opegraphella]|nr:hypothetical protein [Xylographa opegraphella]